MVIIRQRPGPGARRNWKADGPQVIGTAAEGTTQAQRSWPLHAPIRMVRFQLVTQSGIVDMTGHAPVFATCPSTCAIPRSHAVRLTAARARAAPGP